MQDHKFLKKVRDVVATGWTQNEYARNAAGDPVKPLSEEAVCWCLYGATCKATGRWAESDDRLRKLTGVVTIAEWNDEPGRTQAEVLALLDNRIKELAR